jgi:nitrogen fixation NifU-like protein
MSRKLDKFIEEVQKKIIQKDIEDHNEKIISLFHNPQNWGKPSRKDITVFEEIKGKFKTGFFGIYLKIEKEIITKANFLTDGCGVMVAVGSQLTILLEGNSIEFAEKLNQQDLINALNGIPHDEIHCVELAIKTLRKIVKKYKNMR